MRPWPLLLALALAGGLPTHASHAATITVAPGQSLQEALLRAADGDVDGLDAEGDPPRLQATHVEELGDEARHALGVRDDLLEQLTSLFGLEVLSPAQQQ